MKYVSVFAMATLAGGLKNLQPAKYPYYVAVSITVISLIDILTHITQAFNLTSISIQEEQTKVIWSTWIQSYKQN